MKKSVLKKHTAKLPMTGKVRKGLGIYCAIVLALVHYVSYGICGK